MDTNEHDIELMVRAREGDALAFEELIDKHKMRVFNLVYRFLGSYSEAEDLSQEVFVKVYRALDRYEPSAKFTTWLYIITKNTCLKSVRKAVPPMVSIDQEIELSEGGSKLQVPDTDALDPAESALLQERTEIVKTAIDALPEEQRMAVLLHRYERLSYQEIARVMVKGEKAVKSLLHRAKTTLKEQLAQYVKL